MSKLQQFRMDVRKWERIQKELDALLYELKNEDLVMEDEVFFLRVRVKYELNQSYADLEYLERSLLRKER